MENWFSLDRSSLVALSVYGGSLVAFSSVRHGLEADLAHHSIGLWVVAGAFTVFLISVIALQRALGLGLLALHFGRPVRLVTSGPFRYTRNPIYCLFLIPIISMAIYSALAAGIAALAYVLLMNRLVIRNEERVLRQTFGAHYDEYMRDTPRWLV